jgi:Ser/Thr protein kinase RdoA (MazF antagonist)
MQKPFFTLSQRGQVRRMTRLALKALEAYAVPVASVTPLAQKYNKTFRIAAQNGEQYMLRICHPRRTSVEVVRSELLWLVALRQEADLNVPEPVQNKAAHYVTVVSNPDVSRPYLCTLFHWINGRFLYRTLTPSHLFQVGELMACLHHHATHWERPAGFTRRRVDNLNPLHQEQDDHFDETVAAQAIQAVAAVSTPQEGKVVAAVIQKVWAVLQALGEGPGTFGLMHSDLHHRNYLFHNGQVGAIDFDDCSYGHWLYDLAVTIYYLNDHPDFAALREAFLTGYRRSRPLSTEQEEHLGTFMALRALQDLLWVLEERDQPAFRARWQVQTIGQLRALREFVNQ